MMIAYEVGCRYFELSYPFDLSEKGQAIVSSMDNGDLTNGHNEAAHMTDLSKFSLNRLDIKTQNLYDKHFEKDTNVIDNNCSCFSCANKYTRAYIHHLLKCKELNGTILLIMHNLHFCYNLHRKYTAMTNEKERMKFLSWFLYTQCEKSS